MEVGLELGTALEEVLEVGIDKAANTLVVAVSTEVEAIVVATDSHQLVVVG